MSTESRSRALDDRTKTRSELTQARPFLPPTFHSISPPISLLTKRWTTTTSVSSPLSPVVQLTHNPLTHLPFSTTAAIRAKRLAQLQSQGGGGGGPSRGPPPSTGGQGGMGGEGGGQGGESQEEQLQKQRQEEEQLRGIMATLLEPGARERCTSPPTHSRSFSAYSRTELNQLFCSLPVS